MTRNANPSTDGSTVSVAVDVTEPAALDDRTRREIEELLRRTAQRIGELASRPAPAPGELVPEDESDAEISISGTYSSNPNGTQSGSVTVTIRW